MMYVIEFLNKCCGVFYVVCFLVLGLVSLPLFAAVCPGALPTLLPNTFSMSFDAVEILDENGSVKDALLDPSYRNILFQPGISNNAVNLKADSYLSFNSNNRINPSIGKISFWFKPDWDGNDIVHTRMLLDASPFRVFVYKGSSKTYFVFRYDDAQGNQREVSTSVFEPQGVSDGSQGIVTGWKSGEWHHIEVKWNLALNPGEQYLAYTIDGKYSRKNKNTWHGINAIACSFTVGSRLNGTNAAEGSFDELNIDIEPDRELYLSLENKSSVTSINGVVNSVTQFGTAVNGNGLLANAGVDVKVPGAGNLDVIKGRATFWFKPEWDGNAIEHTRYLLDASPFRVFVYKGSTRSYFVFRFDDGGGAQREVSSSSVEPGLIESWLAGQWHFIDIEWDLSLPAGEQYLKYTIDKTHTKTLKHTWTNIQAAPSQFSVGASQGGALVAGGVIDELEIYSTPGANELSNISFASSLESLQRVEAAQGTVIGTPVFSQALVGQGVELGSGDVLSFPAPGRLNNLKGSISFNFKPNWNGFENSQIRYLFDASPFRILIYYSPSSSKTYFVFRFDDAQGNQKEASTSYYEPAGGGDGSTGVVSAWKAGEWHRVELIWDLTGEQQHLSFVIDGIPYRSQISTWSGVQALADNFSIGSHRSGAFPADGVMDELVIYDQSLFDKNKPIESFITTTRNDGIWQQHETIYSAPQDAAKLADTIALGNDTVFYQKANFDAVYEGTVPLENEIVNELGYRLAANEKETLFFNVYSRKSIDDLIVQATVPTKASGQTLDVAELYLVKNWWQAGASPHKSLFPHYIPELLISDDLTGDGAKLSDIKQIRQAAWSTSNLPSLPALNYVRTSMKAFTSRQFALRVSVPAGTEAGEYFSTIALMDVNGQLLASVPLRIEVQAYDLLAPGKDYWTYHRAVLPEQSSGSDVVSLERYIKQIEDIKHHGLTGLLMYGADVVTQTIKLDAIQQIPWDGKVMSLAYSEALRDLLEVYGYEPWFYGRDEPNSDERIVIQINRSYNIHNLGVTGGKTPGKVITAIKREWAEKLVDPSSYIYSLAGLNAGAIPYEPLDYANLSLGGSLDYIQGLVDGMVVKDNYPQSYYWQSMQENPSINRSYAGFYLWLTGLDGVFPYVYQHVRNNPYDDFDIWSTKVFSYRDHLTTYPSQQGPVGTIQWEAYREGIDDVRYLQTWTHYYELALSISPVAAQVSKQKIEEVLTTFSIYGELEKLPATAFEDARTTIQDEIVKLKGLVAF